jgi:hypothetical protein
MGGFQSIAAIHDDELRMMRKSTRMEIIRIPNKVPGINIFIEQPVRFRSDKDWCALYHENSLQPETYLDFRWIRDNQCGFTWPNIDNGKYWIKMYSATHGLNPICEVKIPKYEVEIQKDVIAKDRCIKQESNIKKRIKRKRQTTSKLD